MYILFSFSKFLERSDINLCNGKQEIIKDREKYTVRLKSRAENNKANIELIKFLKKHFKAQKVRIKSGFNSGKKVVEIVS